MTEVKQIFFTFIIIIFCSSVFATPSKLSTPPLRVIIDPGHGGNDQGTSIQLSTQLIKESDLTLKLSQKILKIIQEKYAEKIQASVTRTTNRYVPLQKRISLSRSEKTDFYISLHYNSAFSSALSGTEIYFPENNKIETRNLAVLDAIKQDLVETGRIKQSLSLTKIFVPHWKSSQVKIRRAPFYVLEKADAPALLIEVGYLSHPEEQKTLLSDVHQDLAAESIVKALLEFKENRDKQLN